jgi:hypothetical protein
MVSPLIGEVIFMLGIWVRPAKGIAKSGQTINETNKVNNRIGNRVANISVEIVCFNSNVLILLLG